MTRKNLLSVLDIAKELNTGKATIKFLLKRFKKWLPCEYIDAQAFYPPKQTLKRLFIIQESMDMGILPSEIEKKLDSAGDANFSGDKDILPGKDSLMRIESLFQDIGVQQEKIARAQEKRAAAEERKAFAMEKMADAEEKKAAAFNMIASALQEMSRTSFHGTMLQKDADPINQKQPDPPAAVELDDLAALIDEQDSVVEEEIPRKEDSLQTDQPAQDLDDLSLLIQEDPVPPMDDLSKLIDENETEDIPVIKIDVSPKEDIGKYKAALTKIIIGLKADGVTVEKAVSLLNKNKIQTLSGKPEWSQKAISQIYKFIESAT